MKGEDRIGRDLCVDVESFDLHELLDEREVVGRDGPVDRQPIVLVAAERELRVCLEAHQRQFLFVLGGCTHARVGGGFTRRSASARPAGGGFCQYAEYLSRPDMAESLFFSRAYSCRAYLGEVVLSAAIVTRGGRGWLVVEMSS